jgi:hypothetical protein
MVYPGVSAIFLVRCWTLSLTVTDLLWCSSEIGRLFNYGTLEPSRFIFKLGGNLNMFHSSGN